MISPAARTRRRPAITTSSAVRSPRDVRTPPISRPVTVRPADLRIPEQPGAGCLESRASGPPEDAAASNGSPAESRRRRQYPCRYWDRVCAACSGESTSADSPSWQALSASFASSRRVSAALHSMSRPRLRQAEILAGLRGEIFIAATAGKVQVAKQRRGAPNMLRTCRRA